MQFKAPWKPQKSCSARMNFFQQYLRERQRFIKHESRKQASLALLILRLSLRGNQALTAWLERNPAFTERCCPERQDGLQKGTLPCNCLFSLREKPQKGSIQWV